MYAFDENLTTKSVKLNGFSVEGVEFVDDATINVVVKVSVINSSGNNDITNVPAITINSATLEYIAGENPQFTATSAQSSQYNVEYEKFENINTGAFLYNPANSSLNTGNLITIFEGGETYSYEIKVTPASDLINLASVTKFTIGNVTYDLVFDGNNANTELDNGSIIFRGVPNIVIAGAIVPTTYTLTFETYGGSTLAPLTNINENTVINLSSYNPTLQNYDFDGWYSDPELQNRVTSVTMTDNITVYAKWTLNYGDISLTYINPTGLSAISINDTTVIGNTITGYITSNYKNTFKISPAYLEGYTVTSVVVTDANSSVTNAGPGTVNEVLEFQVNGSTAYDIEITLTKETAPAQTYNVTYNLSGLVSSNTNTEITNEENYTTTLLVNPPNPPVEGIVSYALPSTVRVLIGEVEYNQVNYNSQNGELTIPKSAITNDITIEAQAVGLIAKPTASVTEFTYDGGVKNLVVTGYYSNLMSMVNGELTAVDANNYSATYSLSDKVNTAWTDGTTDDVVINWTINKAVNTVNITLDDWVYGNTPATPDVTGIQGNASYTLEYKVKGANDSTYTGIVPIVEGQYTVRVTIPATTNYLGGTATDDFEITIHTATKVTKPTAPEVVKFIYTGKEQTFDVGEVNTEYVVVSGTPKATNAGEYTVTYTLKNALDTWEDDTTKPVTINWTINKAELKDLKITLADWVVGEEPNEPVVTGNLGNAPYTIQYKSRAIAGSTYSDEVPTEIGSYRVKVEVEESQNYLGNVATSNFEISSNIIHVDMPQLVTKSYLYTGEPITVEAIYYEDKVNATGLTYTEIGTYQARFTLKQEIFVWGDGTREDKVIEWKIVSGAPEVKTSYTYNSTKLTITEDPSVTGFQIKECNSKGESCKQLYKGNKLSYTHTKRKFNTTYYYKVRSYTTVDGTTTYGPYTDLLSIKATLNAPKLKSSKNRYQEVKLTWNKEDGASKYYLYRCNEDGSGCKNIKTLTGTKYYDKSGKEGVTYQYKVRAYRLSKYSKYSSLTEGLKLNDDLTVKVKNSAYLTNTINIKYKEGATKYEVYKSTNNRTWKLIKTINVTDSSVITDEGINVTDKKDLSFNKKVYYRVRANNGVNNTSYTTKNVTTSFVNAVTVNATTNRYQEVKLTCDKSTGAEKYYVYTCDEDGNNCKELATTKSNSYTDKKAKEGKSTFYKVRAYKAKKYSKYSNLAQGFRVNDNLSVTLENNNYKEVTVRVQKLSGAYKYHIEKSTDNKTWKALESFTYDGNENVPEEIMYVDTSAPYNKKVYYRVRANNGVNYTAWTTKNITTSKKAE